MSALALEQLRRLRHAATMALGLLPPDAPERHRLSVELLLAAEAMGEPVLAKLSWLDLHALARPRGDTRPCDALSPLRIGCWRDPGHLGDHSWELSRVQLERAIRR